MSYIGTGDSGKSTVIKQMKLLYLNGFKDDERKGFIPAIHYNILIAIKDIIKGANSIGLKLPVDIKVTYIHYVIRGLHPYRQLQ